MKANHRPETVTQYKKAMPPEDWSPREKRYAEDVDSVFRDIYRRYGRLRVQDLSQNARDLLGTFADQGEVMSLADAVLVLAQQVSAISAKEREKYHVGVLILDTTPTNPASYLGFGEWALWGQGRVPVGVDATQAEFNAVEKTGGSKTHTLSIEEAPSHVHAYPTNKPGTNYNWGPSSVQQSADAPRAATDNAGGGKAHNNLQPYVTCYMWKRIA